MMMGTSFAFFFWISLSTRIALFVHLFSSHYLTRYYQQHFIFVIAIRIYMFSLIPCVFINSCDWRQKKSISVVY